ncbi:hypothetical protein Tco_1012968, partial [Tanacetum coccineum]
MELYISKSDAYGDIVQSDALM